MPCTLNSNITGVVVDVGWEFSYLQNICIKNSKVVNMSVHIVRPDGSIPNHDYTLFTIPNAFRPNQRQFVVCELADPTYANIKLVNVEINTDGSTKIAEGFATSTFNRAIICCCFITT